MGLQPRLLPWQQKRLGRCSSGDSFVDICGAIEGASSQSVLRVAFERLDKVMRIFYGVAPGTDSGTLIRDAVMSFQLSDRLHRCFESSASPRMAITAYKEAILGDLVSSRQRRMTQASLDSDINDRLFEQFFSSGSPAPAVGQKRVSSSVFQEQSFSSIPKKKSRVPALAALQQRSVGSESTGAVKKNVLITREKLRAGFNNPKGLLNLVNSSTNALEHTKKLELLKTSGLIGVKKSKSFADKVNEATVRLGLGLGGHTVDDSLIFGARVLSCPGFLTNKNISDIQNNIVEGKTTWRHQNMYGKLMIAGCINQAIRIFGKYDDVLYGSSPEVLVKEAHRKISELLCSDKARAFLREVPGVEESAEAERTEFIKSIIEAIAPVVPITLRNKSLDGSYFRTALHLLAAAEL